ncbi:hypothetical protein [Roseateles sp.]|uniref:hypothetical protein n=1 Tax=Roseateles sp. TaxID=1971397 RepID=UPI00286B3910|nr:hypothetical protein [Roseateles sp.]
MNVDPTRLREQSLHALSEPFDPVNPENPTAVAPRCKTLSPRPDIAVPDDNLSVAGEEDPGASLDTSGLASMSALPAKC